MLLYSSVSIIQCDIEQSLGVAFPWHTPIGARAGLLLAPNQNSTSDEFLFIIPCSRCAR